ncbi:sigma-54 dependent transcriptional regulator [uncultured Thiocystis sp.]|jgi:DNA-binding NtrC family response regulator|uniref:sigma-54-dependent transcriptional regulator n=1 Tax=uncultured Thiocystis sp. TaxID=1202134 RepID=UPI0026006139|nr:sigma-54 dependent transcriptional regulator [uncultured Thiocystis sp.]
MTRVCLIEDDPIMGEALVERLTLEGFRVDWQRTGRGGLLTLTQGGTDLAVIDVNLPDLSGVALFERLIETAGPLPPTLFITGYGTIEDAVRLLKLGAADYLTKPLNPTDLIDKLRALAGARCPRPATAEDDRLGIAPAMCRIAAELTRLARHTHTPVLISGESGVGKEVVARRLHRLQCPDAPFVAVNCAALPETLVEAELFGHEKGAFTGAERRRAGVFEQAGEGILFLDEIGDMPLALQSRLLRVVQSRQLTRIGGHAPVEVPARLICATHRDLVTLVREGRFREDLYYRVRVLEIQMPPLRERPEDILWLADRFVAEHGRRFPEERRSLSGTDREHLLSHPWPGNVRELHHTLERACILGHGQQLALDVPNEMPAETGLKAQAQAGERAAILAALAEPADSLAATAVRLGISRKTLWQKMKRYGLSRPGAERSE